MALTRLSDSWIAGPTKLLLLWYLDFGGVDPIRAACVDFIQAPHTKKLPSDGLKPSAFRDTQQVKNTQIPYGRPCDSEEFIPVTLLYPVFCEFVDDCQTGVITEDDYQFAGKPENTFSDLYTPELDRVKVLEAVFKDGHWHINFDFSKKIPGMDYSMGMVGSASS